METLALQVRNAFAFRADLTGADREYDVRHFGGFGGCARAYVCLGKTDRATLNLVKTVAESMGYRYLARAYGAGPRSIYLGYDNGKPYFCELAESVAFKLREVGVPAYACTVED